MHKRIGIAYDKFESILNKYQEALIEALVDYRNAISKGFSDVTSSVFKTQNVPLMHTYSELASYLLENSEDTKRLAGALEKIVDIIEGKTKTPEEKAGTEAGIRKRKKKGPAFIRMKQAVNRLKEEEMKYGLPEEELATYAAYSQRVRYQILHGNLHAKRKNGRISKIPEKQFEKLVPYMVYKPAGE